MSKIGLGFILSRQRTWLSEVYFLDKNPVEMFCVRTKTWLSEKFGEQIDWVQPWFSGHRGLFSGQKPGRDVLWTIGWGTARFIFLDKRLSSWTGYSLGFQCTEVYFLVKNLVEMFYEQLGGVQPWCRFIFPDKDLVEVFYEQLDWVQPWFPGHRGLFSGQKPGTTLV